jgi:hypothetical protein
MTAQAVKRSQEKDYFFLILMANDNQPNIKPMMIETKLCAEAEIAELSGNIKCTANAMLATMPMNPANLEMASLAS